MAGSGQAPCDGAAPAAGCARQRGPAEQRPLPRHWDGGQRPGKLPGIGVVRQPTGSGHGPDDPQDKRDKEALERVQQRARKARRSVGHLS